MAAKVYCTLKGGAIQIGNFGVCSLSEDGVEVPVLVSDDVATELEEEIRGERPNPKFDPKAEPKGDGTDEPPTIKIGSGARKDIRVVREAGTSTPVTAPAIKPLKAPSDKKE
jgi:hypothetical protein